LQIVALDRSFYKLYRQDIVELSELASRRLHQIQSFERLRRHGISGEEAAEILGVSRSTLYRWRQRPHAPGSTRSRVPVATPASGAVPHLVARARAAGRGAAP
jgi:hypothetical protein